MKTELNTHNLSLFIALSPNNWTIHVSGWFPHSLIRQGPSPPRTISQQNSQRGSGEREASRGTIKEIYTHFPHVHTRSTTLFTSRWNVLWNSHPSPRLTPGLTSLHFQQPKINHGVNRQMKWKKASARPDSSEAPVALNPRTGVSKWLSSKTVCLRLDCLYMQVAWGFSSSFTKVALPAWVFVPSRIVYRE